MSGSWTGVSLVALLAMGTGLRLWQIGTRPGWDSDEPVYADIAGHMAHGSLWLKPQYGLDKTPWVFHPPLHFLVTGAWFRLFGTGITQARVWGALMSMCALVLLYLMLRSMLGDGRALVAVGLLLIDPWMVYASRVSSIENTLMVLLVAAMWSYWHALQRPSSGRFVASGVLLGVVVCYKFTGAYVVVAVLLNWLILHRRRRLAREHLWMLGTAALVIALFLVAMTVIYWDGGANWFWKDSWIQLQRTLPFHGDHDTHATPDSMVTPLFRQYRVFVATIAVAVAAGVLVMYRLFECVRSRSLEPVQEHALLFSWMLGSVLSFGLIGLKFPTYFQLLLVPMFTYLTAEVTVLLRRQDVTTNVRLVLLAALAAAVVLSGLGFKWRIVDHHDNAMRAAQEYAQSQLPRDAVVLAEEAVGTMIPQRYCVLARAEACQDVAAYAITYTTFQHPLSREPAVRRLLARADELAVFTGFKERVTVWRLSTPGPAKP